MSRCNSFAALRIQLLKSAVSKIAKQDTRGLIGILRQFLLDFGINASGHKKHIRVPVVIEINYPGTPACKACLHPDLRGTSHLVEIRLPVIPIKTASVADKMRLEQVEMSVEVIVSDPDAHSRLFHSIFTQCNPASDTFFTKGPVAIVHKQQAGS